MTDNSVRTRLLRRSIVSLDRGATFDGAPCWEWAGVKERGGYGQIRFNGRMAYTHRVAYELWFGPIPGSSPSGMRGAGLEIDHRCRNRACVNPAHLEAVTRRANIHRGDTINVANAAKTHCPSGHEYTPSNTITERGRRLCRTCKKERDRAYEIANRERRNAQKRALYAKKRFAGDDVAGRS